MISGSKNLQRGERNRGRTANLSLEIHFGRPVSGLSPTSPDTDPDPHADIRSIGVTTVTFGNTRNIVTCGISAKTGRIRTS